MPAKSSADRLCKDRVLLDEAWRLLSPATQAAIVERFPPDGPAEEFMADMLAWWRSNRPACFALLRGMQRDAYAAGAEAYARAMAGIEADGREDAE